MGAYCRACCKVVARKVDHFVGVSAEAKAVLLERLFTLLDWLGADAPPQKRLAGVLRSQNIERGAADSSSFSLSDARRELVRTIGDLPIANALAHAFPQDDKLADAHNLIAVWVIIAVLRERADDTVDAKPHVPALRAVRLLQTRPENHTALRELSAANKTIESVVDQVTALCERGDIPQKTNGYLRAMLVVLGRMQNDRSPYHVDRSDLPLLKYKSELIEAPALLAPDAEDADVRLIRTYTYVEEDGETEAISPDIPSHSDLVLAVPVTDHIRKSDADFRKRFARGAALAMHMRASRAISLWGGFTTAERKHVVKTCISRIDAARTDDTFFYFEFLMVLLFGRSVDDLRAMGEFPDDQRSATCASWWSRDDDGNVYICYWPSLPSKRSRAAYRNLLAPLDVKPLRVRVPAALQPVARDYLPSMHRRMPDSVRTRYLWNALWDGWPRRPGLGRLPDEICHSLMARMHDSASMSHLIGQPPKHNPALYYATIDCDELAREHGDIALRLFEYDDPTNLPGDHAGSRLAVDRRILRRLFPAIRDSLSYARMWRGLDDIDFHNRYIAITFLLLSLATAHRPVRAPFQSIRDFDLIGGWMYIDDKEVRQIGASRIVPLTKVAAQQITAYSSHLRALSARQPDPQGVIAQAIREALSGEGFLLFFIEASGPAIVTPGKLKRLLENVFPLPLNWPRHFWRTALRNKVSDELMNALMGHAELGGPAFASGSTLSLHDLEPLRSAMDGELDSVGALVIKGLTT